MDKKTRFSVIIPGYNIEDCVAIAIESVLKQDFKDYELIVIDDCSTDRTVEVVSKYENVKLIINEENRAAGGARNAGLDYASGEYVIFLDADDYLYANDVLSKIDHLIGNQNVDVVYMGFKMGGSRDEFFIPTEETCTKSYRAAVDIYPNVWSKCWNLDFLNKNHIRFVEKRYYEDVLFIYEAIMKVDKYLIADFPVHTYIAGRTNSMTSTLSFKNVYDTVDNIKDMLEIKRKEDTPELNIRIKREIEQCKARLEEIYKNM